jgi:hypothetical protein
LILVAVINRRSTATTTEESTKRGIGLKILTIAIRVFVKKMEVCRAQKWFVSIMMMRDSAMQNGIVMTDQYSAKEILRLASQKLLGSIMLMHRVGITAIQISAYVAFV